MNGPAAITGASKVAFVTAEAISHGDTASSRGHRPAATATSASASGDPAGSSGTGSALTAAATFVNTSRT